MKRLVVAGRSKKVKKPTAASPRSPSRPLLAERRPSEVELKDDGRVESECWSKEEIAILRRAAEELTLQKGKREKSIRANALESRFQHIAESLDNPSARVRTKAVRALYDMDPDRATSLFNLALRDCSPQERREIGAALATSGLVDEAINNLMGENHGNCYGAFTLLFLVAKAGEVQPLIKVIEEHSNIDLKLAVVRLLASSGGPEVVSAFRRLAMTNTLSSELRSAVIEAADQLTRITPSAA